MEKRFKPRGPAAMDLHDLSLKASDGSSVEALRLRGRVRRSAISHQCGRTCGDLVDRLPRREQQGVGLAPASSPPLDHISQPPMDPLADARIARWLRNPCTRAHDERLAMLLGSGIHDRRVPPAPRRRPPRGRDAHARPPPARRLTAASNLGCRPRRVLVEARDQFANSSPSVAADSSRLAHAWTCSRGASITRRSTTESTWSPKRCRSSCRRTS